MGGSGGSVAGGKKEFLGLDSHGMEGNVQHVMAVTATFTKFLCFGPKPDSKHEDVFTLRVNGASTTAKCTIPGEGESVVTETLSSSVTIKAGELFDVEIAQGNTAGPVTWALAP
jgi:hypothetical protein